MLYSSCLLMVVSGSRDSQVKPNTYDVLGRGFYRDDDQPFEKTLLKGGRPLSDLHDASFVVYRPIFREVCSLKTLVDKCNSIDMIQG